MGYTHVADTPDATERRAWSDAISSAASGLYHSRRSKDMKMQEEPVLTNSLSKKAAIITGASSGIGRCIAWVLAEASMDLWLVGRSSEELQNTADSCLERGAASVHCSAADLTRPEALIGIVEQVSAQHDHLFCLINNAGLMHPEPLIGITPDRLQAMFNVNLFTPVAGCQAAVKAMRMQGKPGHLINISSLAAREDRYGGYGISKSAVDHLGRTLRHELERDDIRVTTIAPGAFATNLSRGFPQDMLEGLESALAETGLDLQGEEGRKAFGDPMHIARAVLYVLQQPIELNLEQITIRPAIAIDI